MTSLTSKQLLFAATFLAFSPLAIAQTTTCPSTPDTNSDCAFILTIGRGGSGTISAVTPSGGGSAAPYDGPNSIGGSLVGVVNNSGSAFTGTFTLKGGGFIGIFGFTGDGICTYLATRPTYCDGAATGYEGPLANFSGVYSSNSCDLICGEDVGTVSIRNLPSGGKTYFALNGSPDNIVRSGGISVLGGGRGSGPVCPITANTNTDCAYILTINSRGVATISRVPNANPYDGTFANGTLVGVVNNSGAVFSGSYTLSGSFTANANSSPSDAGVFDFYGASSALYLDPRVYDGICNYAFNAFCGNNSDSGNFFGFEGPQTSFTNIGPIDCGICATTGTVNITNLSPHATTYFSLQGSPAGIAANGGIQVVSGGPAKTSGTVCPTTSNTNTDCAFVVTIGSGGAIKVSPVTGAAAYDFGSSSLVGIVNNSGAAFTGSFTVSGKYDIDSLTLGIFRISDYEFQGVCSYALLPYCPLQGAYEGPLVTFSTITSSDPTCPACTGTVNINSLPAGGSTYFSIAGSPASILTNGGLNPGSVIPTTPPTTPNAPLTTQSLDLGTVAVGHTVSGSVSASGGTAPYSYTAATALPPGMTFSGGTFSGTPSQPGSYNFVFVVTDAVGGSVSGSIAYSAFGFTTTSLPAGVTFSPYLVTLGVAGGAPPYVFSISGLPKGLSATTSGTINGTVTSPVTAMVSVTAKEQSGASVSQTFPLSFTAPAPLAVPSQTLAQGTVSTVYSQGLTATGGALPYTWTLLSGALPAGLSLRPTGVVSGIPAESGTFNFGVRATDLRGASAGGAVSLIIAPQPITITTGGTTSTATNSTSVNAALANAVTSVEYPAQTISALGGVPPYTFTVTGGTLPPGLSLAPSGLLSGTPNSPGSYTFTVSANDSTATSAPHDRANAIGPQASGGSGTGTATFTVSVNPFTTDLLLSTTGLTFSIPAGSTAVSAPQVVGVQSTSAGTVLSYSVNVSPANATWLSVTPANAATPSTLNVGLNSLALNLGAATAPYQATVSVTCLAPAPCAGNSQQFGVSVLVSNLPPQLTVLNNLIAFTTQSASATNLSQNLSLQNTGGGSVGIASISCAASWCAVTGVPGSIGPGPSLDLPVSINTAGLSAGFYRTTITIKASTGVYVVPVTLFLASGGSLNLAPSGALFTSNVGGTPNGADSSFLVGVNTTQPITWTASVLPGASWLTVQNASAPASATEPGHVVFALDPGVVAGLPAQTYYGTIRVTSPGLVNSPQDFQVVLNVSPANTQQRPAPSPVGLLFISAASATPPPQAVQLTTNSTFPVSFQASATTSDGRTWLSVSPATGSASPGFPATVQVSVNPANLAPGVYHGGVNFAYTGQAVRTTGVTLLVTTGAAPREVSRASCSPSQLVATQLGLVGNFQAPVAWPTPLAIQLLDDCGTPVTNSQVVATFSNGDPALPLPIADPAQGIYAGTWTPRHASPQLTINAKALAPGLPALTAQLAGAVTPNTAPLIGPNGALNLFNPQVGAALAPGTLVQISGTGLAGIPGSATAPLPTKLNGTQVLIGGILVPIASATSTSLTAQVPFELAPAMQYQVIVSANGALTTPATIQLSGTSPGLQANSAGLVAATHADGRPVTEDAPATPGEFLSLFAVGLGSTDTPVDSGAAGPASPLANAVDTPSVTINDEPVAIQFAGLQPGVVGIYQINVQVPADAPAGDLTLVVSQDGNPANTTILPVKAAPAAGPMLFLGGLPPVQ